MIASPSVATADRAGRERVARLVRVAPTGVLAAAVWVGVPAPVVDAVGRNGTATAAATGDASLTILVWAVGVLAFGAMALRTRRAP